MTRLTERRRSLLASMMKDAIYEAAVAVLTRHGMEGTTMDRVAEEAGVAKGTLYNYYKNKIDLLSEVHDRLGEPIREEMRELVASDLTPREKVTATIRSALAFCERNKVVLLAFENTLFDQAKWEEKQCFFEDKVAAMLEEGVERGDFRPIDTRRAAKLLLYFLTGVIEQKLAYREPIDVEKDGDAVVDILLNGLDVRAQASQGQHKSVLISLKLGEYRFLDAHLDEAPILLLDDVFSELDDERLERVLHLVQGLGQTFITTANMNTLRFFSRNGGDNLTLRIDNGVVSQLAEVA